MQEDNFPRLFCLVASAAGVPLAPTAYTDSVARQKRTKRNGRKSNICHSLPLLYHRFLLCVCLFEKRRQENGYKSRIFTGTPAPAIAY
jgi:hypothetical protein